MEPSESDGSKKEEPRVRASKALGISTDSLSKAKQVIDSGDKKLIEEMDKKGKINSVYKKIKVEKIKERLSQ